MICLIRPKVPHLDACNKIDDLAGAVRIVFLVDNGMKAASAEDLVHIVLDQLFHLLLRGHFRIAHQFLQQFQAGSERYSISTWMSFSLEPK